MRSRFDQSRDREGAVMSQVEWLLHRSTDRFLTGAALIAEFSNTFSEPLCLSVNTPIQPSCWQTFLPIGLWFDRVEGEAR